MTEGCDLCAGRDLAPHYEPEGSRRGLKVYLCQSCGLVQSLPRIDRAPRETARVSGGADWGNVRYGKGFRVSAHMALLGASGWSVRSPKILDVGANRGAFIDAAQAAWPDAEIAAIEPDERVTGTYAARKGVTVIPERLEALHLDERRFDLVYSSHTLEHLKGAQRALIDHARVLKAGGLLLLEVPNIELIAADDILEEWFIDKHLFHFSAVTLRASLAAAGFKIVSGPDPSNTEYLTVLATPETDAAQTVTLRNLREVSLAERRIAAYRANRRANREGLKHAARQIAQIPGRVVIWGAGRLFDSLVSVGGLDPRRLTGLIDTALSLHVKERFGVAVQPAAAIGDLAPDIIVIASRSFADDIARDARARVPDATILRLTELLGAAADAA